MVKMISVFITATKTELYINTITTKANMYIKTTKAKLNMYIKPFQARWTCTSRRSDPIRTPRLAKLTHALDTRKHTTTQNTHKNTRKHTETHNHWTNTHTHTHTAGWMVKRGAGTQAFVPNRTTAAGRFATLRGQGQQQQQLQQQQPQLQPQSRTQQH
jgi:hypothetical protein